MGVPVRHLARVLGLLAALGLASRAAAQESADPPPDAEAAVPTGTGLGGSRPLAGMEVSASLGGGWDSNASFGPDGSDSATAFGQAGLVRRWQSPNWATVANIGGGGSVYQSTLATSRYQIGGGLNTTGQLGTLTTVTLGGSGGTEYTDVLSDPATAGLVLPITRSRRVQGNAGLERTLGARTKFSVGGSYARYFFDAEELADTETVAADAALSRTLSLQSRLSLSYSFQSNQYDEGERSRTHTLSVGIQHNLTTRTSLSLSAGGDRTEYPGSAARWTFAGDAAFTLQGERTSLSLGVSRGVTPGPGLGQDRILNLFSVAVTSTLRPWATLVLSGSGGLNQDPVTPDLNYWTESIDLALSLRLSQTLGLTPQIRYRRRGEVGAAPPVDSLRLGVALDYSRILR